LKKIRNKGNIRRKKGKEERMGGYLNKEARKMGDKNKKNNKK
jgi:hypothetical protein